MRAKKLKIGSLYKVRYFVPITFWIDINDFKNLNKQSKNFIEIDSFYNLLFVESFNLSSERSNFSTDLLNNYDVFKFYILETNSFAHLVLTDNVNKFITLVT